MISRAFDQFEFRHLQAGLIGEKTFVILRAAIFAGRRTSTSQLAQLLNGMAFFARHSLLATRH